MGSEIDFTSQNKCSVARLVLGSGCGENMCSTFLALVSHKSYTSQPSKVMYMPRGGTPSFK